MKFKHRSYIEQKPVEYLNKDKVCAIMTKLTNLSDSKLIPINSDEFKKLHEITSDVRSLLDYPIEQKPVVTHGETYHVDTLGTQQVIAGKMPQKPAEWSEKDEETIKSACYYLNEYGNHIADVNMDKSNRVYKTADALKFLRPNSYKNCNSRWKPSEEQIGALKALNLDGAISYVGQQNHLISLYNDLKKLM